MKRAEQAQDPALDSGLLDELTPQDQALVERVLAHHPTMTVADAIRDLEVAGGLTNKPISVVFGELTGSPAFQ